MFTRKTCLYIVLGSFILAFGLFNFNEQNNITEGGSLGLGLLLEHHFDISPAISLFLFDLCAFGIGIRFFGKDFLVKSLLATTSFAIFYGFFEKIGYIMPSLEDIPLLAAVLSGAFVGIGVGLVVRTGAASNGDDSIALIIKNTFNLSLGKIYFIMDIIIILFSLSYLSFSHLIYSLIAVTISGYTIERISCYQKESSTTILQAA